MNNISKDFTLNVLVIFVSNSVILTIKCVFLVKLLFNVLFPTVALFKLFPTVASQDGCFILWKTRGEEIAKFDKSMECGHKSWINACGFVPNSNDIFITASEDGTVKMWDLKSLKHIKIFFNSALVDYDKAKETKVPVKDFDYDFAVKTIAFSKDGSLLAYGGRNSNVYLLNMVNAEFLQTIVESH